MLKGWRRHGRMITYKKSEDGVVAVEFALVAVPFFMMLIGIVEMSMFFTSGIVLEGASADAARLLRTGQVQMSTDPQATFESELCEKVGFVIDCDDIQYEVIRVEPNTFSLTEENEPEFDEEGRLIEQGFNTGNSNDVVLIRTVYRYQFMTPFIAPLITGDPGKDWLNHVSTTVVRAEPYEFGEE